MDKNKTLADVQPGGRVRLSNVRDRVMGECEQWFDTSDVDMEAATDSIIAAAQPSPGGQVDALTVRRFIAERARNPEHRQDVLDGCYDSTDWFGHVQAALAVRQPVRIYGCCAQLEGELHTAECPNMRHLAARQPAGQDPVVYVDRVVDCDEDGTFVGVVLSKGALTPSVGDALYAAPPAQAVDLGQFREAVMDQFELVRVEETHTRNAQARIAAAEKRRDELLALIDSKA